MANKSLKDSQQGPPRRTKNQVIKNTHLKKQLPQNQLRFKPETRSLYEFKLYKKLKSTAHYKQLSDLELKEVKQDLEAEKENSKTLRNKLSMSKDLYERANAKKAELEVKNDELEAEICGIERNVRHLIDDVKAKSTKKITRHDEEKDDEIEALRKQLEAAELRAETAISQRKEMEEDLKKVEHENKRLKQNSQTLEAFCVSMQGQLKNFTKKINEMNEYSHEEPAAYHNMFC